MDHGAQLIQLAQGLRQQIARYDTEISNDTADLENSQGQLDEKKARRQELRDQIKVFTMHVVI